METKNGLLEIKNLLGQATAAAGIAALGGENAAAQLERLNAALEHAAVLSRNTLEQARPCVDFLQGGKPPAPCVDIGGTVRLLDGCGQGGGKLPYYEKATLVIDEHCSRKTRTVFDQDNKGWKAVPNALKGRLFPDDDQFSLDIALLSAESAELWCDIYVLPVNDAWEFFSQRQGGMLF